MKSVNLIKVNLHGLLNIRFVFLVLLVFTLYFFLSMDLVNHKIMNGFQILYNFYLGPHFLGIEFLKWLFHQTPIILLVCNYFDKQIHEGAQFYIPRVGNTRTWILNLLISFIFIIFLYYGLGFFINFLLITGFYGLFDNINMHIFKPQFDQYILICLSTICVVFFIQLLMVTLRSLVVSLMCYLIIFFITLYFVPFYPATIKWSPHLQGIFAERDFIVASISWSYGYLSISILFILFIIPYFCKKYLEFTLSRENL